MAKYSFRAQCDHDDSLTLVRFNEDSIDEIVANFRSFLIANQFSKELVDDYVPDPYESLQLKDGPWDDEDEIKDPFNSPNEIKEDFRE